VQQLGIIGDEERDGSVMITDEMWRTQSIDLDESLPSCNAHKLSGNTTYAFQIQATGKN
jgi:hypothetical protein